MVRIFTGDLIVEARGPLYMRFYFNITKKKKKERDDKNSCFTFPLKNFLLKMKSYFAQKSLNFFKVSN